MKFYLYLLFVAILDLVGMLSAKYFSIKNNYCYLFIPVICFGVAAIFISLLLKFQATPVINMLWVTISTILVAIASYFLFKETLSTTQVLGMLIALIGVIMLEWK